jgi:hypothetical protein
VAHGNTPVSKNDWRLNKAVLGFSRSRRRKGFSLESGEQARAREIKKRPGDEPGRFQFLFSFLVTGFTGFNSGKRGRLTGPN